MATEYTVTLDTPAGEFFITIGSAEYYKREDGWVTFKDREHKVITDIPESRIRYIARNQTSLCDCSTAAHVSYSEMDEEEQNDRSGGRDG